MLSPPPDTSPSANPSWPTNRSAMVKISANPDQTESRTTKLCKALQRGEGWGEGARLCSLAGINRGQVSEISYHRAAALEIALRRLREIGSGAIIWPPSSFETRPPAAPQDEGGKSAVPASHVAPQRSFRPHPEERGSCRASRRTRAAQCFRAPPLLSPRPFFAWIPP